MRVLVVEDSAIYRGLIQKCLTKWGFAVTLANDGRQAWTILQSPDAPKLVLLDWMLPGINGLEICRRLRREESSYSYIIVLTVKNETKDMLAAMRAGVDDYLAKPFDELELRARLMVGKRILWLRSHANAGASVGISIPLPVNGLLQRSKRL